MLYLAASCLDRVAAEHLLQLVGRDRQVLAVADPGFDLIAEARLLQLGDDRAKAALAAAAQHFAQHGRKNGGSELAERALERGEFSSESRIPMATSLCCYLSAHAGCT